MAKPSQACFAPLQQDFCRWRQSFRDVSRSGEPFPEAFYPALIGIDKVMEFTVTVILRVKTGKLAHAYAQRTPFLIFQICARTRRLVDGQRLRPDLADTLELLAGPLGGATMTDRKGLPFPVREFRH